MAFNPNFTISHKLLRNIKEINTLILDLNYKHFPQNVLYKLEKDANALSAYSSTSIEGNPLPLTEVRKVLKTTPEHIRDSEKEVLNYNRVLEKLSILIKTNKLRVNKKLILYIHKDVIDGLIEKYRQGAFRIEPVFVFDPKQRQTIYLPPDSTDVIPLINDLLEYIDSNSNKIDTIILAGLFHKQFVIIHPFIDGNGRTTRLITKVLLAKMGLNTFQLFSFENYYNNNVSKYFEKVGVIGNYYDIVNHIEFTEWLEYFTDGIVDELLRVKKQLLTASTPKDRLEIYHEKIIDFIKSNGFITDKDYLKLTDRAKATRAKDFNNLINLKYIKRMGVGRSTYYVLFEED